ncbi:MAG: amidohydrolase family protein [Victivallaceae bacterium]|jgi:predicted TIM-barrel fold metal-dependent hydrolase
MKFMEFEIIDCHIHPFLSRDNNLAWFPGTETPDLFVEEMKRAGIAKCCGSVAKKLTAPSFDQIKALNCEALKFRELYPDFFIPGIHVLPSCPEESCREIEELYHRENIRWIGELVGDCMDYKSYLGDAMFKIYDLIQEFDIPVNIHPFRLDEMETICKNFPNLKLVIAHPCDGQEMRARFEFVKTYPNAYLDLSGTGLFRWGMLRYGIDKAGMEKILFGSDFPVCNPSMNLQAVFFEHLTGPELKAVLGGNFKRLIGMAS